MRKISMLAFVTVLGSCSSNYYQRPESISSKMERYKSKDHNENLVPLFQAASGKISTQMKSNRSPASAIEEDKLPQNNKKFYFLTLFGQYKNLSAYIPKDKHLPEINYCPYFHSSLVDYNESKTINKKQSRFLSKSDNLNWEQMKKMDPVKYPELTLPMTENTREPRVVDILENNEELEKFKSPRELVQHAMIIHLNKTYRELTTLCEYGNSANYYHYENLLGHIDRKGQNFKADGESIKILLKTTLFSNLTLLNSLETNNLSTGRLPASATSSVYNNPYHQELLKRMNAPWAVNYLQDQK